MVVLGWADCVVALEGADCWLCVGEARALIIICSWSLGKRIDRGWLVDAVVLCVGLLTSPEWVGKAESWYALFNRGAAESGVMEYADVDLLLAS